MSCLAPQCPGCSSLACDLLARIDAAAQHANYSPRDSTYQKRMTAALGAVEYELLKCRECGLEYTRPMRNPGELWYELAYNVLDLYPNSRWEFGILKQSCSHSDKVLELGCGDGALLRMCHEAKIDAVGLDFSKKAITHCRKSGLRAYRCEISRDVQVPDRFKPSRIVAFHVLEHLSDPGALFAAASSLAGDSASLWIAVPSDRRPTRVFKENDFLDEPPHHLTRWTAKSLREIGLRNRWQMHRVVYEPISLRTVAWHVAVRSKPYIFARKRGFLRHAQVERLWRWLLYPSAVLTARRGSSITGFSMVATFEIISS